MGLAGNLIAEVTHPQFFQDELDETYITTNFNSSNEFSIESIDGKTLANCSFSDNGHPEKYKGQKIGLIIDSSSGTPICTVTKTPVA